MWPTNKSTSIEQRVQLITAVVLLGILGVYAFSLHIYSTSYYALRYDEARRDVGLLASLLDTHLKDAAEKGESGEKIKEEALKELAGIKRSEKDYFWVIDTSGMVIWHPVMPEYRGTSVLNVADGRGKMIFQDMIRMATENGRGYYSYYWPPRGGDKPPRKKTSYFMLFPQWGWIIGRGVYEDDVEADIWETQKLFALAALIITLISLCLVLVVARTIVRPIVDLNGKLRLMSEGNFNVEIGMQGRKDEIGDMARTVHTFLEKLKLVAELDAEKLRMEETKNDFISVVSHELRTPLTSIHGSLGLMTGTMSKDMPEKMQQLVAIAYRNSERLILLVNDILDINKIASGQMNYNIRTESVAELMKQAAEATRPYAETYIIRFDAHYPEEGICIRVDAARFVQVMLNLLSNAAKFSPGGGKVDFYATAAGGKVRVSVKDYGLGIPMEFRAQIFTKFSQSEDPMTRSRGGSGLGLFICKQLIEGMGGAIGYDTQLGIGTEFWIEFPLMPCGAGESGIRFQI